MVFSKKNVQHEMDASRLRQGLPKTTTYILCSHLLFSVNSVHIVAWCEIKNVC